jgi:glycosyltransferase involved in cell wall biosynthesis
MRIACVQNGDYTTAAKNFAAGGKETYNGQFYTVAAFQRFVGSHPHLVVSVDAPEHEEEHGNGVWCGIPEPRSIIKLPRRFVSTYHGRKIIKRVARFQPTHLLLRSLDIIGCELLEWANTHGVKTAVIVAARFDKNHGASIRYCKAANNPNVEFVANHNRVATETLIDCGLSATKAVAWDLPPGITPSQFPSRTINPAEPLRLVYAGLLEPDKGVQDFVDAAALCVNQGRAVRAVACGSGSLLDKLQHHPGVAAGWLELPGRISHQEVVSRMSSATFVVVPSRKSFNEGLPFVIQESLAVRTPLLLSDHPIFIRYFIDRHGVRFFNEQDPKALAELIMTIASCPETYARLSETTASAWQSIQCPMKFHQLLERLANSWQHPPLVAA